MKRGIQIKIQLIYQRLTISTAVTILCHWTHVPHMINMVATLLTIHPVPPHVQSTEKTKLLLVSHSLLIHNLLQLLLKEEFPIGLCQADVTFYCVDTKSQVGMTTKRN